MNYKKRHNLPAVAVIIVGTNEQKWLNNCLNSIIASNYKGRIEVIYVDNNSFDKSIDFVSRNFATVKIIKNKKNIGFSGANNNGIELALKLRVKYIFLVNPDTQTPKNLINNLVNFMDQHQDFGVVGPLQQIYGNYPEEEDLRLNEWSEVTLQNKGKHIFSLDLPDYQILDDMFITKKITSIANTFECQYVQGAAIFIRSNILKKLKGFDVNYHTFYEEVDLCRKIKWLKYRVALLTNFYIQHKGGGSTNMSDYKKNLMMRNKYYFVLTDPTWNAQQMCLLFGRWIVNDIKNFFPRNFLSFLLNIICLVKLLPTVIKTRRMNKILSGDHHVKLIKL